MARGDAKDLFFRELRTAGLSRPAVNALTKRFEAIESGVLTSPVTINNLPTADPHVVGELWNSAGAVMVSAG